MSDKWRKILTLIFANGVNYLIGFLTIPFLTRTLSFEDNGTYNQILLLVAFFLLLAQLGINQTITIFMADKRYTHQDVFRTSFRLLTWSGLITAGVFALGFFYFDAVLNNPLIKKYILIAVPALFFQILGSCVTIILVYLNKIRIVSMYTVVSNIIRIAGIFISIKFFESFELLIWWYVVFSALQTLCLLFFVPSDVRSAGVFDASLCREMIVKSWPLLTTSLLGMGIFYIDGFIVSNMMSVKEYAVYRNGAIEIPFIASIYGSVSTIMFPNFARLQSANNTGLILAEKRNLSRTVAAVIFPIILICICFSDTLITWYLSQKYYQSFMVFAVYNFTTLIRVNDYQDLLAIRGRQKIILNVNIIAFIYNIAMNITLIHYVGILGAAIAYTSTVYLIGFLLAVFTAKTYQVKLKEYIDYISLLKMLAAGVAVCLLFRLIPAQPHAVVYALMLLGCLLLIYFIYLQMGFLPVRQLLGILKAKRNAGNIER